MARMPELPEVETVCRGLTPHLLGRRIDGCLVREPRLRWPVQAALLAAQTAGRTVVGLRRRAKYLLIDLCPLASGDGVGTDAARTVLVVHLGMTGWLGLRRPEEPRKHDHVLFPLDNGQVLCFNDARRFGSVHVLPAAGEASHRLFSHLGAEPLDEVAFDAAGLRAACRGRTCTIKERLMDASVVVGVGNIYACEALHRAGISPRLPAGGLSGPRAARLVQAVRTTLLDAIANGGTTLRDFLNADGLKGLFAPRLRVYGRAKEPCKACAAPIRRIVLGGRSTYFCPRCQPR